MSPTRAHIAPFAVFMLFLAASQWIAGLGRGEFVLEYPQYWVYPLQTVVCAIMLAMGWRQYRMAWPRLWGFTVAIAVLVLAIWLAPQELFRAAPRLEGFDPTVFPPGSTLYRATVAFRFIRLAVIVPLVEEIFWRGFLLRYLVREDFENVPMGAFTAFSFIAVTLAFALEHTRPDWIPALFAGALFNAVALRTRSLSSCVLAHAVTNLLLGFYIMKTGQWGFW